VGAVSGGPIAERFKPAPPCSRKGTRFARG
jgi:hypothetical protein